jgi:ubiquinone/menaquinone biosynthesis C-methylase UbiE
MKDFWNQRYGAADYAYGEKPNQYFKQQLIRLPLGKVLFPAEGEGRNAVFAAMLGWHVSAFDISEAGREKAMALAKKHSVEIDYSVTNLEDIAYEPASFDALVLVFAHFPVAKRQAFHKKLGALVKPGGHVILVGFSKKHLAFNAVNESAGGPKDESMLFSVAEIEADFSDFEVVELKESEVELSEGLYHRGKSAVIRFVGRKR